MNNLPTEVTEILACPRCKSRLAGDICAACGVTFPDVNGVPVLINEPNSLFSIDDVTAQRETTYRKESRVKQLAKRILPSISLNVKAKANYVRFFDATLGMNKRPRVLVVGGAITGEGFTDIPPQVILIHTDVALEQQISIVCDGHDLPFLDSSLDGVVVQAVLEHVLDPARCVAEIHRVLKPNGVVYAETPFMQQVHAGRYDFTRFTHVGHRYLFRCFDEIESGPCAGTGTALAWSYCYFLQSFFRNQTIGKVAFAFASVTGFWLKYFDYVTIDTPTGYDAASAYYFLGQKHEDELDGGRLISHYKGAIY